MPLISELIARAKADDEEALEQIIRTYQSRVAAMVISRIGQDDEWQDLSQQIFVKMILGLRRLKNVDVFEPWLFRIARNACFDYLRRRRNGWVFVPWQRWHDSIADETSPNVDSRGVALEAAINRLPSDQRELIVLVRSHELSYSRLSQITGQTVAAIKSRLFRARRRLRQLITKSESEE